MTVEEVAETMAAGKEFKHSPSGVKPDRMKRILNVIAMQKLPVELEEFGDNEDFGLYAILNLPNGNSIGVRDGGKSVWVLLVVPYSKNKLPLKYQCNTVYEAVEKVKFIVEGSMAA